MKHFCFFLCLILCFAFIAVEDLDAQTAITGGAICGHVIDSSDEIVVGALVRT
jgi:hypothetical protein